MLCFKPTWVRCTITRNLLVKSKLDHDSETNFNLISSCNNSLALVLPSLHHSHSDERVWCLPKHQGLSHIVSFSIWNVLHFLQETPIQPLRSSWKVTTYVKGFPSASEVILLIPIYFVHISVLAPYSIILCYNLCAFKSWSTLIDFNLIAFSFMT